MGKVKDLAVAYAEAIMDINSCSFEEAMEWVTSHTILECRKYIEKNI